MSCDFNSTSPASDSESLTVGAGPETPTEFNIPNCKICRKKREESVFPKIQTCTCWHDTSRTKSWLNKLNEKGNLELHLCWISKKQTSLHCLLFSIKSLLWNSAKKKNLPFVPFWRLQQRTWSLRILTARDWPKAFIKIKAKSTNIKFHCASYCFCCVHLFFHTSAQLCG